jgi:NAD-dependent dihydropyrimidine dehydrogenase PreA subunit
MRLLRKELMSTAGVIPQSLQLQAQATLVRLGGCHKLGQCAKSCPRRSLFLQSGPRTI